MNALKKPDPKKIGWWIFRHGLAFGVGALAANIDRILDRFLYPAEWDKIIKMFSSLIGS